MFNYFTLIIFQRNVQYSVGIILRASKIIYYISDNFIFSPYTVSVLHDSMQGFHLACDTCEQTMPFQCRLLEVPMGREIW